MNSKSSAIMSIKPLMGTTIKTPFEKPQPKMPKRLNL